MKFLLVTKDYLPTGDASAYIVSYLAEEIVSRGHQVDVLTRASEAIQEDAVCNGVNVYRAAQTLWEKWYKRYCADKLSNKEKIAFKVLSIIRKVYLAFYIKRFPNSEPISTKNAILKYNSSLSENKYDYIIAFFRPYSCLELGVEFKNKNPGAKLVSYYLDLVEEIDCPKFMPFWLYAKKIINGDEEVYQSSDVVVLPVSAKLKASSIHQKYESKISYLEFPTFVDHFGNNSAVERNTFIFAGTLDSNFRNPTGLLHFLSDLANRNKENKYILSMYGGGDCFDLIRAYPVPDNLSVYQYGRVDKKVVVEKTSSCEILINITNAYNAVVPSKIFELFSTGKVVLNIITNGDDGSLRYFEKYPLSFNVDINNDDLCRKAMEFSDFLKMYQTLSFGKEQVKELFVENTPAYVVDRMLDL